MNPTSTLPNPRLQALNQFFPKISLMKKIIVIFLDETSNIPIAAGHDIGEDVGIVFTNNKEEFRKLSENLPHLLRLTEFEQKTYVNEKEIKS